MYDLESLCAEMLTTFKTNLDARIDAINTEKNNLPIQIEKMKTNAYFFNSLDDKAKNYENFAFMFIDSVRSKVEGQAYAQEVILEFDLFINDKQNGHIQTMILRYQRALVEALIRTWNKVGLGYDQATIESLDAVDWKLNNSSLYHKVIGAQISFAIAN